MRTLMLLHRGASVALASLGHALPACILLLHAWLTLPVNYLKEVFEGELLGLTIDQPAVHTMDRANLIT